MKKILFQIFACSLLGSVMVGCKAFHTAATGETATGSPYELILVCAQQQWQSELGDSLRVILKSPVLEIPKYEPLFDVMRILPNNFKSLVERHRNIVVVNVNPEIKEPSIEAKFDATAKPQVFVTIKGPDNHTTAQYLSENRDNLLYVLEKAERDRKLAYARRYFSAPITELLKEKFSISMPIPDNFMLRNQTEDMVWISQEFPTASQGFLIYKYPYEGTQSLTVENLMKARDRFARNVPGPSDGSYMITVDKIVDETGEDYIPFKPEYRTIRIGEQPWIEMVGLWEVENYVMGGPFVSYTTVNKATNEVVTIDCYLYSPKTAKRNMLRELQHLVYLVEFPNNTQAASESGAEVVK